MSQVQIFTPISDILISLGLAKASRELRENDLPHVAIERTTSIHPQSSSLIINNKSVPLTKDFFNNTEHLHAGVHPLAILLVL